MPGPEPGQGRRHASARAEPGARHALAGAGPEGETRPGRSRAREEDMPGTEPGRGAEGHLINRNMLHRPWH